MCENEDYGDARERIEKNTMSFPDIEGMTLRQYYAGQALAGMLTRIAYDMRQAAKIAVEYADALIAELEK